MKVLITGAKGFIGRNLAARLAAMPDVEPLLFDVDGDARDLEAGLARADVIFHLAGVNRPTSLEEYETGNAGFTRLICESLLRLGRTPKIVMTSSIQAGLDNPYGVSKRHAEEALKDWSGQTGAAVRIHRLKNVFGKWSRPDYNSVTATFCHNIARDLPIGISDPGRTVDLIYIDDVIETLIGELTEDAGGPDARLADDAMPSYQITLGDLAGRIQAFHEMRTNLMTPDFSIRFNQCLYATYLSYAPPQDLEYALKVNSDPRGNLAEFIKSGFFGQIFVSRTHPGITRGNHYHHTKTEKFFVISGQGLIRMRQIEGSRVEEFPVRGEDYRVVNIPPGYTHSICNTGQSEMITLFWASEVFSQDHPDTYYLDV